MGRLKNDFSDVYKGLGLKEAISMILLPRILCRICPDYKLTRCERKAIDNFIKSNFGKVITKYQNKVISTKSTIPNIIWVFWWQGRKAMPKVIEHCFNSVLQNANGRQVILLDDTNYSNYATLPEHILQKFKLHKISFPHFSDILRLALLKEHGGLWIDAATFVTKPIPQYSRVFFSPRVSMELQDSPHMSQWVIGVMGGPPQMPLFSYMYDILMAYWEKYDGVFHYLMFDYFVRYGYDYIPWIKELISNRPIESPDFFWTRYNFAKEVNRDILDRILRNNTFISLTYRIEYPTLASTGKETYYTALLKKYDIYDNEIQFRGGKSKVFCINIMHKVA